MPKRRISFAGVVSVLAAFAFSACPRLASPLAAQMILAETPLGTASDSFYENVNVGFSFSIPASGNVVGLGPDGRPTPNGGINFSYNVPNSVIPPFGGFDPNSDARFGIGFAGSNGGFLGLNLTAGQGSDRTYTQTTPYLVLPNGGTGSVSDTSQRPFVTSFIPVVGDDIAPGEPVAAPPRQRRDPRQQTAPPRARKSSAATADLSVAEIKRRQREDKAAEIKALLAKARQAAAEGKPAIAKIHFRNAARRASGDQRRAILDELEKLMRGE